SCRGCREGQWAEAYYPKIPRKQWFRQEERDFLICDEHSFVDCKDCIVQANKLAAFAQSKVRDAVREEREACAQLALNHKWARSDWSEDSLEKWNAAGKEVAAAIRQRGLDDAET